MLNFAPGPIKTPGIIKQSFMFDPPYFTTKEYKNMFGEVRYGMQQLFQTGQQILIGYGSGSLAMEISIKNFFRSGDAFLIISSGKYGKYTIEVITKSGINFRKIDTGYSGTIPDFERFREICIKYGKNLAGLFLTHFETTTGVLLPIRKYVEVFRYYSPSGLIVVDAISTLLSEDFSADSFDITISASQKGLSLPPGLFFMAVSGTALERSKKLRETKSYIYYFDIVKEFEYQVNKSTSVFTPSSYLIQALYYTLKEIEKHGGAPYFFRKSNVLANYVRKRIGKLFLIFSKSPGNPVQIFEYKDSKRLVEECYKNGLVIGSGIRELSENTFRIATFGWNLNTQDCKRCCDIIETIINK